MDREAVLRGISECYSGYSEKTAEDARQLYSSLDDPNAVYMGLPVLLYAAEHADAVGIALLLEAGADAGAQDQNDSNALHKLAYADQRSYAPWAEEKEAARLLLEAGTSTIRKDVDGSTCVHLAAQRGKLGMLQALAQSGKKLDIADKNGETALHFACTFAVRTASSFFKYAKPKYDKVMSETGDDAILAHKKKQAQQEYDEGKAKVDACFAMIECLLDAGLDPYLKDNGGKTPVDIAADCMDVRIPALLNGTWAGEGAQDELALLTKGMELMQAVEKKEYAAVEALLKQGSDPNELYGGELSHNGLPLQGKLPLAVACLYMDSQLVALLLAHGANPGLKDAEGKTPLVYCFGAGVDVSTRTFADKAVDTILKAMVDKGLDANAEADEKGNTLLNLACKAADAATGYNGHTLPGQFVRQLLRYKADPNIADNDGATPLMAACKGRSDYMEDIQISLLEAGADVAARDRGGNTPLMYAAQNANHAAGKAMADMLFSFGNPDMEAVNNEQKTALAFAGEANNEALVTFLLMKM